MRAHVYLHNSRYVCLGSHRVTFPGSASFSGSTVSFSLLQFSQRKICWTFHYCDKAFVSRWHTSLWQFLEVSFTLTELQNSLSTAQSDFRVCNKLPPGPALSSITILHQNPFNSVSVLFILRSPQSHSIFHFFYLKKK